MDLMDLMKIQNILQQNHKLEFFLYITNIIKTIIMKIPSK